MNLRSYYGHDTHDKKRQVEIDLHLAVLAALFPGVPLNLRFIAEIAGMSHGGVWSIEDRALRKLRTRLARSENKAESFTKEFSR